MAEPIQFEQLMDVSTSARRHTAASHERTSSWFDLPAFDLVSSGAEFAPTGLAHEPGCRPLTPWKSHRTGFRRPLTHDIASRDCELSESCNLIATVSSHLSIIFLDMTKETPNAAFWPNAREGCNGQRPCSTLL